MVEEFNALETKEKKEPLLWEISWILLSPVNIHPYIDRWKKSFKNCWNCVFLLVDIQLDIQSDNIMIYSCPQLRGSCVSSFQTQGASYFRYCILSKSMLPSCHAWQLLSWTRQTFHPSYLINWFYWYIFSSVIFEYYLTLLAISYKVYKF